MIVYCREYAAADTSKDEFRRFEAWAEEAVPEEVSAWRTRAGDVDRWFIVVVDETSDERTLSFDWHGTRGELSARDALAFIGRRASRILTAALAGERGRITDRVTYGAAAAPRLTADGVWRDAPPRRG